MLSLYHKLHYNSGCSYSCPAVRSSPINDDHGPAPMHHASKGSGGALASSWLSLVRVSYITPGCSLLVHHGAAMVAVVACPWAVAVVGVSRGVAMVACSCGVVMAVVVVISRRWYHFLPIVVILFPLRRNSEAHFEWD